MNYLNGESYVEVKDHRYRVHPTENLILRKRDPPNFLRSQYRVQNETQIRRNQNVNKNDNDELKIKNYPEIKQPNIQQPKFKPPNCPSCRQNTWLNFDKGYYRRNCEYIFNKLKHEIDKRVRRLDHNFSTRLPYANKKIRKIWLNMVDTTFNSTEDMIDKLQQLKGKTKLKFYQNMSISNDNMNNKMDEDLFAKNAHSISEIYHEVLMLMKLLQTKPHIRNKNNNYYDLYYTVIKNRDEKEIVNIKNENDYINYKDFIIYIE